MPPQLARAQRRRLKNSEPRPTVELNERIPPRERILAIAGDLFYRHGIRAIGVNSIAERAGTQDDPLPALRIKGRVGRGIPASIGR